MAYGVVNMASEDRELVGLLYPRAMDLIDMMEEGCGEKRVQGVD